MENDKLFLHRAIETATIGISNGGGPFGSVIVKDGRLISEAYNRVILNNDPTAHAEVLAIRQASSVLKSHDLHECILYASCEPCPMCLGAIYWSGIKTVFFAADRRDAEAVGFSDKHIYDEICFSPEKRQIVFKQLSDVDGIEVFRIWDKFENKIPY